MNRIAVAEPTSEARTVWPRPVGVCDMKRTVEIAGGGIAGLTTGLAFAQKGWLVRVHEQDSALRILGAGIPIWENGLRVLDALGVLRPVIAGVIPASCHEKRDHNGSAFASSRLDPNFCLYVPLHETLLTALYEALVATGGEVVFNSRPVAADPDGWLHFEDGSSRHADLVVAADGVNSPVRDSLGLLKWRPGGGNIWFLPGTPMDGKIANEFQRLCRKIYEDHGLDYTVMNVCAARFARGLHVITFNREDPDERARADACYRTMSEEVAKRGVFVGRAPLDYHDMHFAQTMPGFQQACAAIKKALDPKGVIAPGRYGIN